MDDRRTAMIAKFKELYGTDKGVGLSRAPGRVNIIGEHTDYNEGFVMPIAISRDTLVAFRPSGTRTCRVYSTTMNEMKTFSLDQFAPGSKAAWWTYVAGVGHAIEDAGHKISGLDMVIDSTVPVGGGLSSSAALEVSTALAYLSAAGITLEKKELALICQAAENKYVGMRCGIMDQYVALFGEAGGAVKIDCRSLKHELVPLRASGVSFVVCDTGVRHELASSEYNKRRHECEQGAAIAATVFTDSKITALRDLQPAQLPALEAKLDPVVMKRVRHVVTEDARVLEAVAAMKAGNTVKLGALLDASHESLRDDYEVSCPELDTMVEIAWEQKGVYGSRMTGGGFGGCTITLIDSQHVDEFCQVVSSAYTAKTKLKPTIYVCEPERGAELLAKAE